MEKKIKKTRHRKYENQFKQEALKQVENGQSVASVSQALGISEALLYLCRKRLGYEGSIIKGHSAQEFCSKNNGIAIISWAMHQL